jgi:hypothetical protein
MPTTLKKKKTGIPNKGFMYLNIVPPTGPRKCPIFGCFAPLTTTTISGVKCLSCPECEWKGSTVGKLKKKGAR